MKRLTIQQAVVEAISEEMRSDERVFHLGQNIGADFGGAMSSCKGLGEEFGTTGRIIDTPISESAMVGAGVGAAMMGMRPIVQIMFAEFLSLVMAPLACDGAAIWYKSDSQVTIPLVIRSLFGTGPHRGHAEDYHSWLFSVPGIKVVIPSTPRDAKGLMKSAIRDNNPVVFLEHMGLYHGLRQEIPNDDDVIPLGKADVKREGRDVTVVATGLMVNYALKASDALRKEGVKVEVVDLRSVVPMDRKTIINSVKKTKKLVVVSETWKTGDSMTEVVSTVAEEMCSSCIIPIVRLGLPNIPRPFALTLEKMVVPDEKKIVDAIRKVLAN
jgi:pyruvate/2-oxoglutarate/acetoin dehydrogenase E1 component